MAMLRKVFRLYLGQVYVGHYLAHRLQQRTLLLQLRW